MANPTSWTGASGTGLWSDAGNWSAGIPGRQTAATFEVSRTSIDVSLARHGHHNPVAGQVTVEGGGDVAFEAGRLTIQQGGLDVGSGTGLTIDAGATVVAHNTQGGSGVAVDGGFLGVQGRLIADSVTLTGQARSQAIGPDLRGNFTLGVAGVLKTASLSIGDGAGMIVAMGGVVDVKNAVLALDGALNLENGALFRASGTVELEGGALNGGGSFALAGATLLSDVTQTIDQDIWLVGGKGATIEAVGGTTLTLAGAVIGWGTLNVGSLADAGTVVLTSAVNDIASVVVTDAELDVQGVLNTYSVTVQASIPEIPVWLQVDAGAQLMARSVALNGGGPSGLVVDGGVARIGGLTVEGSGVVLNDGASMILGHGSESYDLTYDTPSITVAGGNGQSTLVLTGAFNQQAGTLDLQQGGELVLRAGAALTASGFVILGGGGIAGSGSFTLAGGTLLADNSVPSDEMDHDVALGASGGTIEAAPGTTLTMGGAVTGNAPLTIGVPGIAGTVVLTSTADSFGSVQLAAGTLELSASNVAGTGSISFLADDPATLQVDAGVSVGNTIMDFGAGDTIDLRGIDFTAGPTLTLGAGSGGTTLMTVTDGTNTEHLVLGTVGSAQGYTLSADGHGGTDVTYVPPQGS